MAIYDEALAQSDVLGHPSASIVQESDVFLTPPPDNSDIAGDGVIDVRDNCADISNPNQLDWDDDAGGDACEEAGGALPDADGDAVPDTQDKCPLDDNPLQEDLNQNAIGDICEE